MGVIFTFSFGCVFCFDDVSLTSISIASTSKASKELLIGTKAVSAFFSLPEQLFFLIWCLFLTDGNWGLAPQYSTFLNLRTPGSSCTFLSFFLSIF